MIEKGNVVQCPECKNDLYELTVDLHAGMKLMETYFLGLNNVPDPVAGQHFNCPYCEGAFFKAEIGQIHIKDLGWRSGNEGNQKH